MATTRRRGRLNRPASPTTRDGRPDRRFRSARETETTSTPFMPPADKPAGIDGAAVGPDQLIAEANAAMQPSVVPGVLSEPRRRPGRPPRDVSEQNRQAEIEGLASLLTPAFRAMGDTVFHGMLQIPEPQWGDTQASALARAWAPVMQQYVQSPVVAAVVTTVGVTLPYLFVIAQRQVNAHEAKKRARALEVPSQAVET